MFVVASASATKQSSIWLVHQVLRGSEKRPVVPSPIPPPFHREGHWKLCPTTNDGWTSRLTKTISIWDWSRHRCPDRPVPASKHPNDIPGQLRDVKTSTDSNLIIFNTIPTTTTSKTLPTPSPPAPLLRRNGCQRFFNFLQSSGTGCWRREPDRNKKQRPLPRPRDRYVDFTEILPCHVVSHSSAGSEAENNRVKQTMEGTSTMSYENLNMDHIAKLCCEGHSQARVIRALGITNNDIAMARNILQEFDQS